MLDKIGKKLLFLSIGFLTLAIIFYFFSHSKIFLSLKLDMFARKYPPTSVEYRRLKAMSNAIKNGQKYYYFTTDKFPTISP